MVPAPDIISGVVYVQHDFAPDKPEPCLKGRVKIPCLYRAAV